MKRFATLVLLLIAAWLGSGCYLAHVARGQARLLLASRPTEAVLQDPGTTPETRDRLHLVGRVRQFARELGLAAHGQYTSFADWPGDRVVTTVVATRPRQLEAAGFWFPVVGRVPYKGFFDSERARREAEKLRGRGLDVCLVPVPAYSTLGWFDDPLTGPMLRLEEGRLVETLLHELVHATVYVKSDADFNEGLASFLGQEAAVRFQEAELGASHPRVMEERRRVSEDRTVSDTLGRFRKRLTLLYEHDDDTRAAIDAERAALESQVRAQLAALPLTTRDPRRLAEGVRLNDACQALSGTYTDDLERYAARLAELDGDLIAFLAAARAASEQPDPRLALFGAAQLEFSDPAQ